jgi:hypothetical protein
MSRVGPMLSRNDSLHSGLNPIRGGTPSESDPQINILAKSSAGGLHIPRFKDKIIDESDFTASTGYDKYNATL